MDHSLPGSSVHGILQAREWVAPPGDLPNPGIEPIHISHLPHWQAGSLAQASSGRPAWSLDVVKSVLWLSEELGIGWNYLPASLALPLPLGMNQLMNLPTRSLLTPPFPSLLVREQIFFCVHVFFACWEFWVNLERRELTKVFLQDLRTLTLKFFPPFRVLLQL